MSLNHGINTYKSDTAFGTVKKASVSIPFFIGAWPCHTAEGFTGKPQLANNFPEAKTIGGYSDEWRYENGNPKWNLCQAMYSHFKLYGMSPAIFCNIFNPQIHKTSVSGLAFNVIEHIAKLSPDVIDNDNLSLSTVGEGGTKLEKGVDYDVIYTDDYCVVELLTESDYYDINELVLSCDMANPAAITVDDVEEAIEKIEECKGLFGIVPDLICAPGWSRISSVAAVMAAKSENMGASFKGKAVVDLDTSAAGAPKYSDVLSYKSKNGYTDQSMIVCWPLFKSGNHIFDASVIVCGAFAEIDSTNGNCPSESPSNKSIPITSCVNSDGEEINLSLQQADAVSYSAGVVTALNFGGWILWGNYTGCWPANTDVAKCFIPTSRTMDFICNTFVNSYWGCVDRSLTRVMIDAIVNSFNSYLNGLTHDGKLYGGEIRYVAENNPTTDLIAGKFRLDTKMASPVPAQQINMYNEFDVNMLTESINV